MDCKLLNFTIINSSYCSSLPFCSSSFSTSLSFNCFSYHCPLFSTMACTSFHTPSTTVIIRQLPPTVPSNVTPLQMPFYFSNIIFQSSTHFLLLLFSIYFTTHTLVQLYKDVGNKGAWGAEALPDFYDPHVLYYKCA